MTSLFTSGTVVWALAAVGLAGFILHQVNSGHPARSSAAFAPSATTDEEVTAAIDLVPQLPSEDLIERTVARPLFSESRRPAAPRTREQAAFVELPEDNPTLELIGTMLTGDAHIALLKHPTEGLQRRRVGQSIGEWKIVDVQDQRVSLEGDDGIEVLLLREARSSPIKPPRPIKSTKVCGQLSCCDDGCGEIDVGFEADISFVISRGDASEFFDFGEIVFDQMAP